jgi:hypothetical protein
MARLGESAPTLLLVRDKQVGRGWGARGGAAAAPQAATADCAGQARCAPQGRPPDAPVSSVQGKLFGGVASQPWQKRGTFYGDFGSFVFSLLPGAAVSHATGINQNFQW